MLKRLYHKFIDSATRTLREENREIREHLIHIEDKIIERTVHVEDKESDLKDGIIELGEKLNLIIAEYIQKEL